MNNTMYNNVRHPEHYQGEFGMEVIDVIENFTAGLNGIEATDTGNIIKYACRWHKKNGIEDLEKIIWYCEHLINYINKKELIAKVMEEQAKEERVRETEITQPIPAIDPTVTVDPMADVFDIDVEIDGGSNV